MGSDVPPLSTLPSACDALQVVDEIPSLPRTDEDNCESASVGDASRSSWYWHGAAGQDILHDAGVSCPDACSHSSHTIDMGSEVIQHVTDDTCAEFHRLSALSAQHSEFGDMPMSQFRLVAAEVRHALPHHFAEHVPLTLPPNSASDSDDDDVAFDAGPEHRLRVLGTRPVPLHSRFVVRADGLVCDILPPRVIYCDGCSGNHLVAEALDSPFGWSENDCGRELWHCPRCRNGR